MGARKVSKLRMDPCVKKTTYHQGDHCWRRQHHQPMEKKKKVSMNPVVINLHTLLQLNKFSPKTQNISTWGAKKKLNKAIITGEGTPKDEGRCNLDQIQVKL